MTAPVLRTGLAVCLFALGAAPLAAQDDEKGRRARMTTADGVELYGRFYPGTRDSACVLLLHAPGAGHDSQAWRRFPLLLQSKGYAVLAFDFRGHGRSTVIDPTEFWSPRHAANRTWVRGSARDEEIDVRDFDRRYFPVLANDIAAARAYLDRQNDQGECNASNLILVGAGEGATLGALWLNGEFRRHRFHPAMLAGFKSRIDPQPEGDRVLCCLWLGIRPTLGSRSVNLSSLLDLPSRQRKLPTLLVHARSNERDRDRAAALARFLRRGQKLPYSDAVEIPDVGSATGAQLLTYAATQRALVRYLDTVVETEGKEWDSQDAANALYVWAMPGSARPVAANIVGRNVPNFGTYENFLPAR